MNINNGSRSNNPTNHSPVGQKPKIPCWMDKNEIVETQQTCIRTGRNARLCEIRIKTKSGGDFTTAPAVPVGFWIRDNNSQTARLCAFWQRDFWTNGS